MKKHFLVIIIPFLLIGITSCDNSSKQVNENIELIKSLTKNPITEKSFTPSGTNTLYYEIKLDDCFLNLYTKINDGGELYITESINPT